MTTILAVVAWTSMVIVWTILTVLLLWDTHNQLKPRRWVNGARNQYWRAE